jgi:hypothetical protein
MEIIIPEVTSFKKFQDDAGKKSNYSLIFSNAEKKSISKSQFLELCKSWYPTRSENIRGSLSERETINFLSCYNGTFDKQEKFYIPKDSLYDGIRIPSNIFDELESKEQLRFEEDGKVVLSKAIDLSVFNNTFVISDMVPKEKKTHQYISFYEKTPIVERVFDPQLYFVRIFIDDYKKIIKDRPNFLSYLKKQFKLGNNWDEHFLTEKAIREDEPRYVEDVVFYGIQKDEFLEYCYNSDRYYHLGITSIYKAQFIIRSLTNKFPEQFKIKYLPKNIK